eukprot:TRINITY_DN578_c0_g1_i1.p2 TRINITY_DN578_c0_g1~~TRINITY_DN578_c0_g1_i1.p2  ORF type:complete len:392 (+),score=145.11 TRINITY_DN578_c0_g1_i1:48-1223(+)
MAHLMRAPGALAAFAGNVTKYRALGAKYKDHLMHNAKKSYAQQTEQVFSSWHQSYLTDEAKRITVCEDLPMTRKEFTEYLTYKEDIDRMAQPLLFTAMAGGLPLIALPLWANATHKLPSTFFSSEDEKIAAGKARDLEVHIKHAAIAGFTQSRYLELFIMGETKFNEAYDSISQGFMAPKDPKAIRKMGQFIHKARTTSMMYLTSDVSSWLRGQEHYEANAFLGKPHMFLNLDSLCSRIVDHYKGLYQEDALIKKEGLSSLSDFELYQICNRRLIARWEEELTRAQLETRLQDWMTLTKVTTEEEHVPLRVVLCYQAAHFRDVGYLDDNLESLDTDAFSSVHTWAPDAFERRVAFESGPLADQVRAHLLQLKESEAKLLDERAKYIASKGN